MLRGGFRFLILTACVPLIIPPGVCLCEAAEREMSSAPGFVRHEASPARHARGDAGHGHKHGHAGSDHCCCIGELALDEGDSVQPVPEFELAADTSDPVWSPTREEAPVRTRVLLPRVGTAGYPFCLAHLALLI